MYHIAFDNAAARHGLIVLSRVHSKMVIATKVASAVSVPRYSYEFTLILIASSGTLVFSWILG